MHVLWTPSWYPSPDQPFDGSFFAEQATMLRGTGVKVGVIALKPRSVWQRPRRRSIDTHVIRAGMAQVPKGALPGDDAIIRGKARSLARAYERRWGIPDIVHAHSVFPGILLARHLAARWQVPYGLTEHRPSTLNRPSRPRFAAIEKAVDGTDFRAAVSTPFAEQLAASYGKPFDVISLPVPDSFFAEPIPRTPGKPLTFVHVSHLDANKRVLQLIDAFARAHRTDPSIRLRIIGGTPERVEGARERAQHAGVGQAVDFLGTIDREKIAPAMAQGDCFVLTSAKEAGGTVFSEAQSLGLPCIASATWAGRHSVVPSAGTVVPIDDEDALVAAFAMMSEGIRAGTYPRQAIRNRARQRFSAQAFTTRQIKIYESALNTHG
ncbi:MAG: glycosyltransferase [Flaviflexus sp.]|nr:glycosyltransferase [Flaviflexus sp.]